MGGVLYLEMQLTGGVLYLEMHFLHTTVWTIFILCFRILEIVPAMFTTPSFSTCSRTLSMVMNVPVRPTPALRTEIEDIVYIWRDMLCDSELVRQGEVTPINTTVTAATVLGQPVTKEGVESLHILPYIIEVKGQSLKTSMVTQSKPRKSAQSTVKPRKRAVKVLSRGRSYDSRFYEHNLQ